MTVTAHFRALSRRWEGREERPQGRPSAAARPAKGAPRARGTPPTLPQPTPPSLAASARVRRPLRPARAVRRPPRLAGAALGGGAATSLRPASTRQTGRMSRRQARREAWEARRQRRRRQVARTAAHVYTSMCRSEKIEGGTHLREWPLWAAERSSSAALTAATVPGTRAVGAVPSAAAATLVELYASAKRTLSEYRGQQPWAGWGG